MSKISSATVCALLAAVAAAQTPALRKGVSVQMPVTTSAAAWPDADLADSLVVAITARGAVYLEVTVVTPAQLSGKLQTALQGRPGKRVYLKADARVPYSTVAEVLEALRTAGAGAPILLTAQHDPADASYVPPKGLEVSLEQPGPGVARPATVRAGQASDRELRQQAHRDRPIVLEVDGTAPFGDVVHAVDVCHAAGARVILAALR